MKFSLEGITFKGERGRGRGAPRSKSVYPCALGPHGPLCGLRGTGIDCAILILVGE